MKNSKFKKEAEVITIFQAETLQQIGHWGKGRAIWNQDSWNGKEFTEGLSVLTEDIKKEANDFLIGLNLDPVF